MYLCSPLWKFPSSNMLEEHTLGSCSPSSLTPEGDPGGRDLPPKLQAWEHGEKMHIAVHIEY